MKTYLIAFILATVLSALLTPIIRRIAPKTGAIDLPSGRRVHKRTIPRMGGIAIIFAFFAPLIALIFYDNSISKVVKENLWLLVGLVAGGAIVAVLGALDDMRGVGAKVKFAVQTISAVIAFYCGFRIESIDLPILPPMQMGVFALPVTVIWIVGIINAMNLVDGLDGLAAGIAIFANVVNFVISLISGNILVALISVSLAGAVLGFLFYNFNPATIFMGDVGSMFIGFILGSTALIGSASKASTAVSIAVPILALGLPIMDTLLAIVRRFLERRSIFAPDREHIHHKLLSIGLTQRRAVLVLYAVTAIFTCLAILVYLGRAWQIGISLLLGSIIMIGIIRSMGYFDYLKQVRNQKEGKRPEDIEKLRFIVPKIITEMKNAGDVENAKQILQKFGMEGDFVSISYEKDGDDSKKGGKIEWLWENPNLRNGNGNGSRKGKLPAIRGYISASYPVCANGHSNGSNGNDSVRGTLKFSWISERGTVSEQKDILLCLVADAFSQSALVDQNRNNNRSTNSAT